MAPLTRVRVQAGLPGVALGREGPVATEDEPGVSTGVGDPLGGGQSPSLNPQRPNNGPGDDLPFYELEECFRIAGRTTWYERIEEIQADLDRFLAYYNLERSHQGYRLKGRTPAQALREALGTEELPDLTYSQPTEEDAIDQTAAA